MEAPEYEQTPGLQLVYWGTFVFGSDLKQQGGKWAANSGKAGVGLGCSGTEAEAEAQTEAPFGPEWTHLVLCLLLGKLVWPPLPGWQP